MSPYLQPIEFFLHTKFAQIRGVRHLTLGPMFRSDDFKLGQERAKESGAGIALSSLHFAIIITIQSLLQNHPSTSPQLRDNTDVGGKLSHPPCFISNPSQSNISLFNFIHYGPAHWLNIICTLI
jgi:hypothetical protein